MIGALGAVSHYFSRKLGELGGFHRVEACPSGVHYHPLTVALCPDSGAKGVFVPSGTKDIEDHHIEGEAVLSHVQVRQDVKAVDNHLVHLCNVRDRVCNGF